MCGIVGMIVASEVNQSLFDALTVLQHRGQDAAGMVTCEGKHFSLRKGRGLVRDVFHSRDMQYLKGNIGIGHVRYPTAGSDTEAEAQPFYVNSPFGIVLAHNGNLTNATQLREALFLEDFRHMNTRSDSEVILNVFAHALQRACQQTGVGKEAVFKAVSQVHHRCRGAYAIVLMIAGVGLLAFRDPFGIRPLIYGTRESDGRQEVMIASESIVLSSQGFTILRDVGPGEAVLVDQRGHITTHQCAETAQLSPCLFEYVYLARPDAIIDKISVYNVRMNIGKKLAEIVRKEWDINDIDVVVPIPETSRHAAITLANHMNRECREGFVKNRYVGRTFIMPGQAVRKKSVRQKLSIIASEFSGKNVLLIDDSIVRGTTSKEIIQMARDAGAKKVYFVSASPPIRFPNIYGIDMPCVKELVAYNRSVNAICQEIGADGLLFLPLHDLVEIAREANPAIERFESAVFDGIYLTGDESAYLQEAAALRGDPAVAHPGDGNIHSHIDLHNHSF